MPHEPHGSRARLRESATAGAARQRRLRAGWAAKPVEDDGERAALQLSVPAGQERALAGAGEQRHHLSGPDVFADGACLLSPPQQAVDLMPQGLHRLGDANLDPGTGQERKTSRGPGTATA
jgi:hypothetical protein